MACLALTSMQPSIDALDPSSPLFPSLLQQIWIVTQARSSWQPVYCPGSPCDLLTICRAVSLYFYTPISLLLTLALIYKSRVGLVIMLVYFAYIWTLGRRDIAACSYTSSWVKNWRLWDLYASYFPIRLVSLHCCCLVAVLKAQHRLHSHLEGSKVLAAATET